MFSRFLLAILSLLTFLSDFHVSGCDQHCPLKTTFNPPRLVVRYGDPFSVTCNLCPSCSPKVFNLEKSLGTSEVNGTQILWTVQNTTVWSMNPSCYYLAVDKLCCTALPFTVYKPPDAVSIRPMNHSNTDPLYAGREYTLECSVTKVAPIQNVVVTFFRGLTELGQVRSRAKNTKPIDEVFKLPINISAEDKDVPFWCKAELVLGPYGPLDPPNRKSEKYTADVFYKPQILEPSPDTITLTKGDPLHLNCSAVGNPRPEYTWTLPPAIAGISTTNNSVFSIQSVAYEHAGQYTCTVTSMVGEQKVHYNVVVEANILLYVLIAVAVVLVVLILLGAIAYRIWHKGTKEDKYSLTEEFCCFTKTHRPVPGSDPL